MSKINIVLDMSKYDMFQLCHARYNYRYNLNIGLPGKPMNLERGTLVHLGQEVYYEALKNHKLYDEAANMALSKIREAGVISSDLDNEMINRVIDVMEEYYDYWRVADQSIVINEVEQPFMYELFTNDEVRILLTGKIDLIVSDNRYEREPWDHKTYDRTYAVGRMSNQFKNYCVVTGSNYLTVNKIGFQKTLKAHEKFIRTKLTYDPLILAEWKDNVTSVIMNEYLSCITEQKWTMNETSCDKYNRRCEFYEICDSSGLPAKNWKINNSYVSIEPWDVTKIMKKPSMIVEEEKKRREQNAEESQSHPQTEET